MQLPLRIREEIKAQQYSSEILVTKVQLSIIVLFLIINFFTPETYSPNAPVDSASLGLTLFAILTLMRLWFVTTNQLTPLLIGCSIIMEMMLLFFIIWTYYLQYETTETINLKNTHVNYVYILIALRALRFEPKWVVLSGLTASMCWGIMVWHTLSSTSMNVITWDYVTYASTRSIYWGAVFDVFFSILLVTMIIAMVLTRSKEILYQAVSKKQAAKDLARFFDRSVAEKITHSDSILQAGYGETRKAAIMFADIRGFTMLSKSLSPSELIEFLGEYQSLLVPIIQKHHGAIDKFMGDGIMASFGAVTPSNIYAADALKTVDAIMEAIDKWNERRGEKGKDAVSIGIGLAVGEVIFGVIGNSERLEYTVIGETANLAAKLEKHNKVEDTRALTSSDTV